MFCKMLNEESLEDRQNNEFEALKAIYSEDLKDLRKSPWSVWTPLDFKITLTPQQGNSGLKEIHAKLDLHIVCSEEYPNKIPKILLENTRGLSNVVLIQLKADLEKKANELKGEVMIFELAQHVQVFLHDHNKPGTKSFYEEMLLRKEEKEKEEQIKKNKEKQIILTEVARRQEILMQESKLRKETWMNSENSSCDDVNRKSFTNRSSSGSCIDYEEELNCDHKGVQLIQFSSNGIKNIQRGKCLSHNLNSVVFSGQDMETGDVVLIIEWTIETKNIDINYLQKQIQSIEQEMHYLVKLRHINLVPYLNMKYECRETEDKFIIYILQEFVFGCSCMSLFIYENISVDIDMLQHIAASVLSSLDFLHRNNVVHKEVSHSCIFMNNRGIVKVSNFSLSKRLKDLILPKHSLNYGKKQDIYMFGILMLSLIKGKEVNDESFEIPINISNNLYDFLTRCLAKDERERFTAIQLLNHPFLKAPLERNSPKRTSEDNMPSRNVSPENPGIDFKMLLNSNCTNLSRVQTEFEVLDSLGKGAYGEVFKVRNKLDQGYYAIKRIELKPKNKQLNKKIIREVKLLSKLNHENVVRYYNSWIECALIDVSETDSSNPTSSALINIPKVIHRKELTLKDDIELLAPPMQEWQLSYESKSKGGKEVASSDDSSDDDDDDWGLMVNMESEDSDSIEFVGDELGGDTGSTKIDKSNHSSRNTDTVDSLVKNKIEIQFMYIQMEFCEKSTLRSAIDNGLYRETDRMWRLFREIVEGLAHIHQQGMIHRDLKPVNIFLDSNDHVKIGDFGLATTNFISRVNDPLNADREHSQDCMGDGSMTGHVGTALYVAPELCTSSRVLYNQKVDIYSLGIIFFEMCYKPLSTSMERIKILSGLRTKEIMFPDDFRKSAYENQEVVIRWLLNHNVSERPTSHEVLQSDHIPPPVLEECELQEMVRHTLSNPHLKAYKYLVESCFKQTISSAQDITYDKDPSIPYNIKNVQSYDYFKDIILEIFRLHGGQNLSTPLLMPNSKFYDKVNSCTKLMTHSGSIVAIPHDLRVPFARYIAWNQISSLRRYSIERVYREKKVFGFLPRELYECAFDIVTPTSGSFLADAELLYMLYEIVTKIPCFENKNFLIRLNHTSLITAMLSYCGIKSKHNEICVILSLFKEEKVTKFDLRNYLIGLGLSDSAIEILISMLELESPITKIMGPLQSITRKKSETSQMAKTALNELKLITQNAEMFGVELPIVVAPGLLYNMQQYSGMMCQLTCELKKKNKQGTMSVVAAGGRYDGMIAHYRNIMEQADMLGKDIEQSAVGISLSLDKIVQIIQKDSVVERNLNYLDVVVCSVGKCFVKDRTKILKDIWELGLKCSYIEASNAEDMQELCSELHVPHFVILNDSEHGVVRVRSWEMDRFHEQKISASDLVNTLKYKLKVRTESASDQNCAPYAYGRSDSKSSYTYAEKCEHNHENVTNVLFVTEDDDKLSANTRKRYENQIRSQLDDFLKRLNGEVMIVAVSIDSNIVRKICGFLEFDSEALYNKSVEAIMERHQKHKQYISEICDEIYDLRSKRSLPVVILYSLNDSFYRIV